MASSCVKSVGTLTTSSKMLLSHQDSKPLDPQLENEDPIDFEFLLEDPVTMLSADELFSNGKLVPLKFSGKTTSEEKKNPKTDVNTVVVKVKPSRRLEMEISVDPYLFSPRAPRCTVRWRELLGFKRSLVKTQEEEARLSSSSPNPKTSSFKQFLNRNSKTQMPSLPPSDITSSRLSLSSSSSSSHELDDLPRLSLDLPNPFAKSRTHHQRKPRRHHSDELTENESRGLTVTADSPRLNSSGKIVFHGLERSSSSPGNFTGGPRLKQHHGIPRSYSANVRITPVLNVTVSSLRGGSKSSLFFGQRLSSSSSSPPSGNRVQLQSNNTNTRNNRTRLKPESNCTEL